MTKGSRSAFRVEIVDDCRPELGPMLVRYRLVHTRWFWIYLHHFLRSDNDRHFHDHPWSFVTCLLSGGYWENTPSGRFWRRRLSVLYRPATWLHWVELERELGGGDAYGIYRPRPVWTLVLRLRRQREWGFITPDGWVDWQTYGKEWCE